MFSSSDDSYVPPAKQSRLNARESKDDDMPVSYPIANAIGMSDYFSMFKVISLVLADALIVLLATPRRSN